MRVLAYFLLAALVTIARPAAADGVKVFAAGSLRDAFVAMAEAYAADGGALEFTFGPAGLLRERIEKGEAADLFASANMAHPQTLSDAGRGGIVSRFTRNRLCAITKPGAGFTTDNLLERMLDPKVKLAIFTPGADPSGDYALAVFRRADAVRPGAEKTLTAKAMPLLGGPNAPKVPPGQNPIAFHLDSGAADLFLGYCTIGKGAGAAQFDAVPLPDNIAVGADYGLIVLHGPNEAAATRAAQFILSPRGQSILIGFGFAP